MACQFLSISRQAYYKCIRAADQRDRQSEQVAHYVQHVRLRQAKIGTRKLHYLLHSQPNESLKVGRDRLFKILTQDRRPSRP